MTDRELLKHYGVGAWLLGWAQSIEEKQVKTPTEAILEAKLREASNSIKVLVEELMK